MDAVEPAAPAFSGVVIGEIVAVEAHPHAERLKLCRVEDGSGEQPTVVCGAPNAREGITVVVAHPGTYIPGIDTTIQVGRIRGVESHGMICSEREMGLSDAHEGIIELPSGEVGQPFADWLARHDPAKVDPVIEIAITPNRPDALGVHGIARDLAARGLGTLIEPAVEPVPGAYPCPVPVTIDAEARDACPVFYGRLIRGVEDRGVLMLCDPRLRSKGYGRVFLDSLPPMARAPGLDAVRAFPVIIFALALVTILGPSLYTVIFVVAVTAIPIYARIVRTQTQAMKNNEFIVAERAMGASTFRILGVHVLPNVVGPLLILASMDVPLVITLEAGLSFLGLGVRPPTPSWGTILNDGYNYIRNSAWPVVFGGIPVVAVTLGFTFLGEALRDIFDPKLRRDL